MEEAMKLMRYGIAIGLLAGLGACSNMMGGGSSSGSSSHAAAATAPPVAPEMVRQVQSKLRDGGYYKQGPIDGVWGPATEASVRSFQHDHSLTPNGQLDVPTLQALNVTDTNNNSNRDMNNSANRDMNNPNNPPPNQPATQPMRNNPPVNNNGTTNQPR
jgi:peptidoglycan hydrolase-like protein with peptidoglycan-binding domain